jgi:hypothetical protein
MLIVSVIFSADKDTNNQKKKETNDSGIIITNKKTQPIEDNNTPLFIINKIKSEKIRGMREEIEKIKKVKNEPLNFGRMNNKEIKYQKGQVITINLKKGYVCELDFYDNANNKIVFDYISTGSSFFTVEKNKNKLFLNAKESYKKTNLIVGIEGKKYPIIFNIHERSNVEEYNAYVKINLVDKSTKMVSSNYDTRIKSRILNETFKFNELDKYEKIEYESYLLKNSLFFNPLFKENQLKVYNVEKYNKKYYFVLLDKNFNISGYSQKFGEYNNKYNIYFLNYNTNVFTISNSNNKSQKNFIERYRIILKN